MLVITGSGGFVGSAIVAAATKAGYHVRAVVHHRPSKHKVETVTADVADRRSLENAFSGADVVLHAAGLAHIRRTNEAARKLLDRVNVRGAESAAEAAAAVGARRFVLLSSVSVYGQGDCPDEAQPCTPQDAYAASKLNGERRVRDVCEHRGLPLTILRLCTLYGEEDPGNVARLIRAIDRRRFVWVGYGTNKKSLLHRDDAARACLVACGAPVGLYNVTGPPVAMRDVVDEIVRAVGCPSPRFRTPVLAAGAVAAVTDLLGAIAPSVRAPSVTIRKWLADDVYDGRRFFAATGFRPEIPLTEGVRREVAWYRSRP